MHVHRHLEVAAEVKERHRIRTGSVDEQRVVDLEFDLAVRFVVDSFEHGARQHRRRDVRPGGQGTRLRNQRVMRKRLCLRQRSEEHTSELTTPMRIRYSVLRCKTKKNKRT